MQSSGVIPFIITVIRPFSLYIYGMILISFIWAFVLNMQPYIVKTILNIAMTDGDIFNQLLIWIGFYLFLDCFYVAAFRLYDWIIIQFRPTIKKHIGMILMNQMMDQSHNFYLKYFSGNLTTRINDIVVGVPDILRILIDRLFACFLMLSFALYNLSLIHIKFAVALSIWIVVFLAISIVLVFRNQYLAYDVAAARATVTGHIVDMLTNMSSIRLFATKSFELQHINNYMQKSVDKDQTRDWFFLKLHAFQGISYLLLQSVCFWWLLHGLACKTIKPGEFVLVVTLSLFIVENFWNIAKEMRDFWEKIGNISQGLSIIQSAREVTDVENAAELVVTRGEIIFNNVQFQYKNAESLFEHQSIIIQPGEKVGLVGHSGSGKSTFANLILRLFDVTSGSITIDGQNIAEVTQESLHKNIAMIPQDPGLFHRSVLENIQYGKLDATFSEVVAASKQAYAHEFIIQHKEGYNMLVGERGVKISGGQRQRIAIARAILKNAPILILDEATSQLDSVTEGQIQESLRDLMREKTTLVIAHRLSTLLDMDRILVFSHGTIVENGSHQELLQQNGLYKKLWEAQIGGFLFDEKSIHNL